MKTKKKSFEKINQKNKKNLKVLLQEMKSWQKKDFYPKIKWKKHQIKAQKLQREYTLYEQEKVDANASRRRERK